jgi:hypothetical protein
MNPERRAEIEELREQGRIARERMQEIIERVEARLEADRARRERRRQFFQRLVPFRRASA